MLTKVSGGFLGGGGLRDTEGDVAFYSHNENCSGCSVPLSYADNYFDFKFSLEAILKRPVDLLEEKAIRNPYFKESIDTQKKLIYGELS
jgi:hypothetical protein